MDTPVFDELWIEYATRAQAKYDDAYASANVLSALDDERTEDMLW